MSYLLRVVSGLIVVHFGADHVSDASGASLNSSSDPGKEKLYTLLDHNLEISPVQGLGVTLLQRQAALVDVLQDVVLRHGQEVIHSHDVVHSLSQDPHLNNLKN